MGRQGLLLLVLVPLALSATISVSLNLTNGEITYDGKIFNGSSTGFGDYKWASPLPLDNAVLGWMNNSTLTFPANNWNETVKVYKFTDTLYRADLQASVPYVSFFGGNATNPFQCSPIVEGSLSGFTCKFSAGMANFSDAPYKQDPAWTRRYLWRSASFTIDFPDQLSDAEKLVVRTIGARRAITMTNWARAGNAIYTHNEVRKDDGRLATGFLFLIIAAAMFFLVIMQALVQAWVLPFPGTKSVQMSTFAWFLVFLVIMNVLSIAGGFGGWLASFGFVLCHLLICLIFYLVKTSGAAKSNDEPFWDFLHFSTADPSSPKTVWSSRPDLLGWRQKQFFFVLSLGVVSLFVISMIEVYAWHSLDYNVWDRYTQTTVIESQPGLVGKTTLIMYSFDTVATTLQFNVQTKELTHWCGEHYSKKIPPADREQAINVDFVKKYDINMDDYVPNKAADYDTINDWFVRKLAPGARPIPFPNKTDIVGSPADARITVFENVTTLPIWIKNESFSVGTLLGSKADAADFDGGAIAVVRLAPADYHRFHAPVNGKLGPFRDVPGTYLSVNADAATSENNVFYNLRKVMVIDSPQFGKVGYVAIGATCVGSVQWTAKSGDNANRGDEYGFMAFGGSTVILVFQKGKIAFENDLLRNSERRVETLVRVHTPIGRLP